MKIPEQIKQEIRDTFRVRSPVELEKLFDTLEGSYSLNKGNTFVFSKLSLDEKTPFSKIHIKAIRKYKIVCGIFSLMEENDLGWFIPGESRRHKRGVKNVGSTFILKHKNFLRNLLQELHYRANYSRTWHNNITDTIKQKIEEVLMTDVRMTLSSIPDNNNIIKNMFDSIPIDKIDREHFKDISESVADDFVRNNIIIPDKYSDSERRDILVRIRNKTKRNIYSCLSSRDFLYNLKGIDDKFHYIPRDESSTRPSRWARANISEFLKPLENTGEEDFIYSKNYRSWADEENRKLCEIYSYDRSENLYSTYIQKVMTEILSRPSINIFNMVVPIESCQEVNEVFSEKNKKNPGLSRSYSGQYCYKFEFEGTEGFLFRAESFPSRFLEYLKERLKPFLDPLLYSN